MTTTVSDISSSLFAPLPDYAVISVSGADAASFLHGQLTHDVTGLGPGAARLAGYCTAKGRLLATLVMWHAQPADGTVCLLVRRDLAEALIRRLRMFVLRAKVTLALSDLAVHGVQADAAARQALQQPLGGELGVLPWQRSELPSGTWIAAPAGPSGVARWWWIASAGQVQAAEQAAGAALGLPQSDPAGWQRGDLAAGLPWIATATQDLFIPQTVNLDLIDGVSFGKGCYPGQEIVARSHYRGTVKRRMAYGHVASDAPQPAAGADVYDSARPDEPCGRIIDLAGNALLFEAPLDALEGRDLRAGAADGPSITVGPLPYPLVKPS